jgi:predicted  nucleic acid-binding Zn-ribbon protein
MSGMLEGLVALLIAIVTAAVIFGQLRENTKANKDAIAEIKETVEKSQEVMKELIEKNLQDVKDMIDTQKENQDDALKREVGHIKETLDFNIREIRDDIRRLESFQSENAKLREEISLLKQSVRSLHKRLDIEIPDSIRNHDED